MPVDRSQSSLSFDRLAATFDDQRSLPPVAVRALHAAFMDLVDGGMATLIEPGAGTGRVAIPALAAGFQVTALDVSEPMLDGLRQRLLTLPELAGRCDIVAGDALSLPFDDHRFDVGVLAQVLYLIPDWPRALDELMRVVRPGGRVLLVQERTGMSTTLRRWDAAWRDATSGVGYKAIPQEPSDETAVMALAERAGDVTETVLASWAFEQTVGEALAGLERMRPLYDALSDDAWDDAVSTFRSWQARSDLGVAIRLGGTVTLTLVSGTLPAGRSGA